MATRRKYAAEFKQEAVQLVRSVNVPAIQIARDLGIDPNMLSRWCREMGSVGNKAFQGQGSPATRFSPQSISAVKKVSTNRVM